MVSKAKEKSHVTETHPKPTEPWIRRFFFFFYFRDPIEIDGIASSDFLFFVGGNFENIKLVEDAML